MRWAKLSDALHSNTLRNAPLLTLDLGRVWGVVGLIGLVAVILCSASIWQSNLDAASQGAAAALRLVDARLDEIDRELSHVASHPDIEAPTSQCSAKLTSALVRASLNSTLVRRFMLASDGLALTCGPEGQGPALSGLPNSVGTALALSSTRDSANRLMVARTDDRVDMMIAVLDPRAFDARGGEYVTGSVRPTAARIALLAADRHRMTMLATPEPRSPVVPALSTLARSSRYGVAVAADIETASLIASGWQRAPWFIAAAGLAFIAGLALAWRHTLLRARLSHRIESALRKRQFEPYVQPILDLATGRCKGAEVLMRWNHPQRGTLAPGEFIEEDERTGLIVGMSDLVMARAVHRLAPLAQSNPDLYFSFNVTPDQLRQPQFAHRLAELFRPDTLRREQALVELTEREFVDPSAGRVLASLRAAGWRIAVDDFGTGQSSLASLEKLPIDRIKIDRAFVMNIDEQTVNRPVLDAIVNLAQQLNVSLIAEGVETQSQWDYLAARGVQYAQGYLIARPMPIDAFTQWLATQQLVKASATSSAVSAPVVAAPVIDAQAPQLWHDMRSAGGLDVRDCIFRLRSYPNCFVGREAVDWLVRQRRIGRAEAVRLGQRLTALGLINHVVDEHDFKDAELFYRLAPPAQDDNACLPAADDLRAAITGAHGVPVKNHTRGLISHRRCATGRAIVDWMVSTYGVSRSKATQWATLLMRHGALRHVFDDQPFRDNRSLYRPA